MNDLKNVTVTTKQLAEIFGVSESYLSDLVNDHKMPKLGFNKFPLVDCIKFRINHLQKIYDDKIIKHRDLTNRGRLEAAQAELKEIELQEKRKELAPVYELELALRDTIMLLIKGLESLQGFYKFDLQLNPDQLERLDTAIYRMRVQISESGNMFAKDVKFNLS